MVASASPAFTVAPTVVLTAVTCPDTGKLRSDSICGASVPVIDTLTVWVVFVALTVCEKDVVVAAFGRVAKNTLRPIATTARRLTADTTSFLVRDHLTLGLFAIDPRFLSTLTAQSGLFLMLRAPICDEPVRELCGA